MIRPIDNKIVQEFFFSQLNFFQGNYYLLEIRVYKNRENLWQKMTAVLQRSKIIKKVQ